MEVKEDYSDKSFAIYGETKKYKDMLKALGGKFNKYLKIDGESKIGWIFSKKDQENVMDFVLRANSGETFSLDSDLPSSSLDLPNLPSKNKSVYQYVKYKVFKPKTDQKVQLKVDGKTMEGTVTSVETHNDTVDTVHMDFEGKEQLGLICNGKWTIFGYFPKHNLFFSD